MQVDDFGYAQELASGIRCGAHGRAKVYHDSTETVRYCYAKMRSDIADQEAEVAAERAYVRHLEDRGHYEAQAQDEWERRNGVVGFQEAWAIADLENGPGWTGPTS